MTKAGNVLITNFKVNGKSVKFKIDIGEQCNVLQKKFLTASRRNQNTSPLTRSKRLMEEHQFRSRKMHSRILKAPHAKAFIGLQTCQNLELININQVNGV